MCNIAAAAAAAVKHTGACVERVQTSSQFLWATFVLRRLSACACTTIFFSSPPPPPQPPSFSLSLSDSPSLFYLPAPLYLSYFTSFHHRTVTPPLPCIRRPVVRLRFCSLALRTSLFCASCNNPFNIPSPSPPPPPPPPSSPSSSLSLSGQIVQQMYVIACVLGAGLQVALLTQAPAILALMGAGPSTALFKEASGYLKVR